MPRSLRRKTTAPAARATAFAARGAGFTPPFYRCSPPERALARGGGGGFGFARTARQTANSVRARRRLEKLENRVLNARPQLDHAAKREFPAFRSLHLREILPTHLRRQ